MHRLIAEARLTHVVKRIASHPANCVGELLSVFPQLGPAWLSVQLRCFTAATSGRAAVRRPRCYTWRVAASSVG